MKFHDYLKNLDESFGELELLKVYSQYRWEVDLDPEILKQSGKDTWSALAISFEDNDGEKLI